MCIILGDNLEKLREIESNTINLIYMDPPFFTQTVQKLKNSKNKEYSFEDNWSSIEEYLLFMEERLVECKRILRDDGSILLHCDKTAAHYLRVLLDKVFGMNNFINEIIWYYKRWSNSREGLLNTHQNIYFYSKSKNYKFNKKYTDYSPTTNVDQILQKRIRSETGKTVYMKDDNGEIVQETIKKGVPLGDVWEIPFLNPKAKERTGYPTQKPLILLEQLIEITTDEGDIVLDPFCGSGTTLVAAKLLNRKYIGIDKSNEAINLCLSRLENPIKTNSILLKKGKEKYINKTEKELEILNILDATPVQRNKGIDGFLKYNFNDKPIAIKIQKENETFEESKKQLIKSGKSKNCERMILIKTKDENIIFTDNNESVIIVEMPDLYIKNILKELK